VLDAAAVLRLQSPKTALNPVLGFHKPRMVDQTESDPARAAEGVPARPDERMGQNTERSEGYGPEHRQLEPHCQLAAPSRGLA
jgi:hypothetical protein